MKLRTLLCQLAGAAMLAPFSAMPQDGWVPPPADKRCPSKWGAADERGAANLMTTDSVLKAARLIRQGQVYELGKVLGPRTPTPFGRTWTFVSQRTSGPFARNQATANEELVTTELGQVGTQFDGLTHVGIGEENYNCNKTASIASRGGFSKLGIEKVGALVSRGVMLDIAALKGVDILPITYEITVADLQAAIQRQGTPVGKADIVLIRTGWGRHFGSDNQTFNSGEPGIGVAAAEWLAARDIMLVGSDNWGIEVYPNPDKTLALPVHQINLAVNGIFHIENMNLEDLSRDKVYEFAFVVQPLKIRGGTGSTVAPIAIR